jgi:O-antigen/teichoic acid export membrane protein
MAIIAKPLIYLIIGDKWAQSVIYLQLLCIGSIFYPFDVVNLNILILKGRSDLILKNQIIKTILTLIIIISGILFGITVMLIVRILTMILGVFLNGRHSFRLLGYSVKDQFIDIVPYLISEVVIFLFLISINYLPFGLNILFFIQLFSAIILFVIIFEGKKHSEYLDIKHLIINQLFPEYSKP